VALAAGIPCSPQSLGCAGGYITDRSFAPLIGRGNWDGKKSEQQRRVIKDTIEIKIRKLPTSQGRDRGLMEDVIKSQAKKSLKVDRQKFEGIVKNLLQSKPIKREDVEIKNRKNREKLIPPQK
jgi:hypothetical protein